MDEPVLSAHARLRSEEAEALVLQWFDEVGLVLGHAENGRLIAWFDDAFLLPAVAEIAVEVQLYPLAEGWSQLRWCFRHGGSEQVVTLLEELFDSLLQALRADRRWSIDLCRGLPQKLA
jgi:hypothetical protein